MSEPTRLGEVIAERVLRLTHPDGAIETVAVRIGKPFPVDGSHEWRCSYQIEGMGRTKTFAISGIDSVQALLLTLQTIVSELEHIAQREGGVFSWLEDNDSGFPHYRMSSSYREPK